MVKVFFKFDGNYKPEKPNDLKHKKHEENYTTGYITQLFKTGDKEKGFKASRKKGHVVNRGPEIKMTWKW